MGGGGEGGGGGGGGQSNQPDNNDDTEEEGREDNEEQDKEPTTLDTETLCTQTQVQCTQLCSVIPTNADEPPTTTCEEQAECSEAVDECAPAKDSATTTTFTTISAGGMCEHGSDSPCGAACKRAVTTGPTAPYETGIPWATGSPEELSPELHKRLPVPEIAADILTPQFQSPGKYPGGPDAWFGAAKDIIYDYTTQHFNPLVSSVEWSLVDELKPFITGAPPSWGCTTIGVISDRGIWLGHVWESPGMIDHFADFLSHIRNGGGGQPSLASARD